MGIKTKLNVLLAEKNMKLKDLAALVGIDIVNLSKLKTGKARAIRMSTFSALCHVLQCQPGDLFVYEDEPLDESDNNETE